MDFTLAFMCSDRFSRDLNGDTSCILYFFGLGKNTKKVILESSFNSFLTL